MSKTTSKPNRRYGMEKILLNSEGTNPADNLNHIPDVEATETNILLMGPEVFDYYFCRTEDLGLNELISDFQPPRIETINCL